MFIVVAFSYDSLRPLGEQFATEFWNCTTECHKDQFLLSFILLVATAWISVRLYYFRYSVLLKHTIRGLLADYALFIGVILVTIFAQFVFAPLPRKCLDFLKRQFLTLHQRSPAVLIPRRKST
jgi:hypothetical protein